MTIEIALASTLTASAAEGLRGNAEPGLAPHAQAGAIRVLAEEVRSRGWIAYGALSPAGDWDLFVCRPNGSQGRNLTQSPGFNEAAPQFSRDGRKLLYRRLSRSERIEGNRYGEQGELVIANSDGSEPKVLGKPGDFPWASWSPDGRQIACLSIKGISFVDLATQQTSRRLDRKGFFQQLAWSPDGRWLCGVANSYGTGWSIARMEAGTGEASVVNRVDCCTPDWFPDSRQLVFSWRPPGQKGNHGQGWTQLWRVEAEGESPQLVYGEDGRHVYGGHVSPDGQYVLFTGNMEEDGDPGRAGAPMGLMRLGDAPIIGGESQELRTRHPRTNHGPVLTLPAGWEPCWTLAEIPLSRTTGPESAASDPAGPLAAELHDRGWLVLSAKTARGDWDLFLLRPDGSSRHPITNTPQFNEAGARFSPDGTRLLYYRLPRGEAVDNNTYGTFDLVVAHADGTSPVLYGPGFPWASWGPDGKEIACLAPKGIQVVDLATRRVVREFPRGGLVQQLVWSPDGTRFAGTANGLGPFWNIGVWSPQTAQLVAVSETERYNCTPDWCPDSAHVVYARGIIPNSPGRAELWVASSDGGTRGMLYAEADRHIYGACPSPDATYLLFTRSVEDLGKVDNSQTTVSIIRWTDTPIRHGGASPAGEAAASATKGPRLDLGLGWEPHWTYHEVVKTTGALTR